MSKMVDGVQCERMISIPIDIVHNPELSPGAKLLYGEIANLINHDGYCIMTNAYFADLHKVSAKTIGRWLGELYICGYIYSIVGVERGRRIYLCK